MKRPTKISYLCTDSDNKSKNHVFLQPFDWPISFGFRPLSVQVYSGKFAEWHTSIGRVFR